MTEGKVGDIMREIRGWNDERKGSGAKKCR